MFEIPLEAMKVGGLRIALSLHCIGQQNTPNKGTWLARQCDDGVIEIWFNNPDQSGMFSITLTELTGGKGTIAVERHGPRPSLVYQLQESLQLHKLLDELETLAFGNDEEVEDENDPSTTPDLIKTCNDVNTALNNATTFEKVDNKYIVKLHWFHLHLAQQIPLFIDINVGCLFDKLQ